MSELSSEKLENITPDPTNANCHSERGNAMLRQSMEEFGFAEAGTLDKHNRIIGGNHRTEVAADILDAEDAIIIEVDGTKPVFIRRKDIDLSTERGKRLAYALNRVAQVSIDFDPEQVLADISAGVNLDGLFYDNELDELLADIRPQEPPETPPQIDRAEELRQQYGVELGQIWQLGEHRIVCGDCTDKAVVKAVMDGEWAEMMFTDPPYGVAVGDKNKFLNSIAPSNRVEENLKNDDIGEPELLKMLTAAFDNAMTICTAGGAWYVAAPPGPLHILFGQVLKDRNIWRQTIQWVKNSATFSPLGVDYHWQAEPIFYGWLPGAAHRYYGGRQQTTVWEIDRPTKSPEHPTMKPVELVERAVRNSSQAGEIVYDPFLGSGTTIIACENLSRRCRAIEIDPGYIAVSLHRWAQPNTHQPALIGAVEG